MPGAAPGSIAKIARNNRPASCRRVHFCANGRNRVTSRSICARDSALVCGSRYSTNTSAFWRSINPAASAAYTAGNSSTRVCARRSSQPALPAVQRSAAAISPSADSSTATPRWARVNHTTGGSAGCSASGAAALGSAGGSYQAVVRATSISAAISPAWASWR